MKKKETAKCKFYNPSSILRNVGLLIACPECGTDEGNHIKEVFTRVGTEPMDYSVDVYPGTKKCKDTVSEFRRPGLVIVIESECQHRWELIIQQQKGMLLFRHRMLKSAEDDFDDFDVAEK